MENKDNKIEQLLLWKREDSGYWRDVLSDTSYSDKEVRKMLSEGWKISNFNLPMAGTQSYTYCLFSILLEK